MWRTLPKLWPLTSEVQTEPAQLWPLELVDRTAPFLEQDRLEVRAILRRGLQTAFGGQQFGLGPGNDPETPQGLETKINRQNT